MRGSVISLIIGELGVEIVGGRFRPDRIACDDDPSYVVVVVAYTYQSPFSEPWACVTGPEVDGFANEGHFAPVRVS